MHAVSVRLLSTDVHHDKRDTILPTRRSSRIGSGCYVLHTNAQNVALCEWTHVYNNGGSFRQQSMLLLPGACNCRACSGLCGSLQREVDTVGVRRGGWSCIREDGQMGRELQGSGAGKAGN